MEKRKTDKQAADAAGGSFGLTSVISRVEIHHVSGLKEIWTIMVIMMILENHDSDS
jgi:hypothetical protein